MTASAALRGSPAKRYFEPAHIVPWSLDPLLRLDPRNGLCLNALHDAAFDRGLITFSDTFELRLSRRLKAEVPGPIFKEMFECREGTAITMPERFAPAPEMLETHRTKVFLRLARMESGHGPSFIVKIESFEGSDTFVRCGDDEQDFLFAVVGVDDLGRAEILDGGYRSHDEAAKAWPEAAIGADPSARARRR